MRVAIAGRDRSAPSGIGVVCAPNGNSGTTQRQRSRRPSMTVFHRESPINTPCSNTTTGPSPPVSEYMRLADVGPRAASADLLAGGRRALLGMLFA